MSLTILVLSFGVPGWSWRDGVSYVQRYTSQCIDACPSCQTESPGPKGPRAQICSIHPVGGHCDDTWLGCL